MPRPAEWVNPLDYVGTFSTGTAGGTTAPYPGNLETQSYDPTAVGGGVAQYYGTVTSALPTFDPIQRNIAGVPSPEERRIIGQAAAERGIGIGSYGAGNDMTAYLRALGLTSRALTNQGIEQYGRLMATIPALSPQSLFITPTQQAGMNLQWAQSQAELNAAMARQRASDQAALERARVSQETAYGTANIGARSREYIQGQRLASEQAYNEALRQERAAELAWQQQQVLAQDYGVGGYDPWGGGVYTPAPAGPAPGGYDQIYGEAGSPGGTGTIYFGEQFPSFEAEADVFTGGATPEDYGVGYDYYDPGTPAYEPFLDDIWF